MEKRKRLSAIGKQRRIKVRKLDEDIVSYCDQEKNVDDEEDFTVGSLNKTGRYLRSNDFEEGQEPKAFTNAVKHVKSSQQLSASSDVSTHYHIQGDTRGSDHLQKEQKDDTQGLANRTYLRDDSGYKSDDFSESDENETDENCVFQLEKIPKECLKDSNSDINIKGVLADDNCNVTSTRGNLKTESASVIKDVFVDESDEIVTSECVDIITEKIPKPVDRRWARNSLESNIGKHLYKTGTVKRRSNSLPDIFTRHKHIKPNYTSTIYILHEHADTEFGDEFGAELWTFITQQGRTVYKQHFLVDVKPGGPAAKMKISSNDELVLLNGRFVPDLDHGEVLNLFKNVTVDGRTRFKLVLRRLVQERSKKEWEWIETSAVLSPDSPRDKDKYPEVKAEKCNVIRSNIFEEEEVCWFKTSNKQQHYLDIKNNSVVANVMTGTDTDKSKRIKKKVRIHIMPGKTQPGMTAALFCEINSKYIVINKDQVSLDETPMYFDIGQTSDNIFFKNSDKYLACNPTNLKIETSYNEYMFEEFPADGNDQVDHCKLMTCLTSGNDPSICTDSSFSSTRRNSCINDVKSNNSNSKRSQQSMEWDTEVPSLNKSLKLDITEKRSARKISSEILKTPTTPFELMCM